MDLLQHWSFCGSLSLTLPQKAQRCKRPLIAALYEIVKLIHLTGEFRGEKNSLQKIAYFDWKYITYDPEKYQEIYLEY